MIMSSGLWSHVGIGAIQMKVQHTKMYNIVMSNKRTFTFYVI